jgi:hypothetical protein
MLDLALGTIVWENTTVDLEQVGQLVLTSFLGTPVALLPASELGVVDLTDGVVKDPIELAGVPGNRGRDRYAIEDLGGGEIFVVSDRRDALGISADGDVLWDYPRVTGAAVERGDFTGDGTEDFLVRSKVYSQQDGPPEVRTRVLYVVDGQSKQIAWTYTMPYEEFTTTGGIGGVMVAPDLNQDGKQDIVGYIQKPVRFDKQEEYGEDSKVLALSGADGSVILRQPVTDQTYYGKWETLDSDPAALEQMIRDRFAAEMESQFPGELARQQQQQREDFQRNIEDQWRQTEQQMRDENRRQLERNWEDQERDRWRQFEDQLQADIRKWREDGTPEQEIADTENVRREEFK